VSDTILVTGAAGFVGSHLLTLLATFRIPGTGELITAATQPGRRPCQLARG
jgi:uncharacterized protein YbjT (DUF2867 family)